MLLWINCDDDWLVNIKVAICYRAHVSQPAASEFATSLSFKKRWSPRTQRSNLRAPISKGYNRGAVQLTSRDLVHVCPCNLVGWCWMQETVFFLVFIVFYSCLLQFQPSSTQWNKSANRRIAKRASLTSCRGRHLTPMGNGPRWVCPLCWPSCTPGGDDGRERPVDDAGGSSLFVFFCIGRIQGRWM